MAQTRFRATQYIIEKSIEEVLLNDSVVSTRTLQDASVTNAKLAADSVQTINILDANVTKAKLADKVIDSTKLDVNASNEFALAGIKVTGSAAIADSDADATLSTVKYVKDKIGVLAAQVSGGLIYQGLFNAATATALPADPKVGFLYKVSGNATINGLELTDGDIIIANQTVVGATTSTQWDRIDAVETVTSVNGAIGNVKLHASDLFVNGTDKTKVTDAEFEALSGVTSGIQAQLDLKLDDSQLSTTIGTGDDLKVASTSAVKAYGEATFVAKADVQTDETLGGATPSEAFPSSEKAVKVYVDARLSDSKTYADQLIDNDVTLAGDSATKVASQHAVKTFVEAKVAGAVTNSFVTGEVVSFVGGKFVLSAVPQLGTEGLYLNGIRVCVGAENDYTIVGAEVTFTFTVNAADRLVADYRK